MELCYMYMLIIKSNKKTIYEDSVLFMVSDIYLESWHGQGIP